MSLVLWKLKKKHFKDSTRICKIFLMTSFTAVLTVNKVPLIYRHLFSVPYFFRGFRKVLKRLASSFGVCFSALFPSSTRRRTRNYDRIARSVDNNIRQLLILTSTPFLPIHDRRLKSHVVKNLASNRKNISKIDWRNVL